MTRNEWAQSCFKNVFSRFRDVYKRQILLSDDVAETLSFYRRLGWQPVMELHCQALIKIIR